MDKTVLNINFASLQGFKWVTSRNGDRLLVVNPAETRMKYFVAKDGTERLYGKLDVVPLAKGSSDRKDTHFVAETTTSEERSAPGFVRLPIVGSAQCYASAGPPRTVSPQGGPAATPYNDEIPF